KLMRTNHTTTEFSNFPGTLCAGFFAVHKDNSQVVDAGAKLSSQLTPTLRAKPFPVFSFVHNVPPGYISYHRKNEPTRPCTKKVPSVTMQEFCAMSGRPMKTIDEIRRENARALADAARGNAAFSAKIDRETTQASRFIGKNHTKNIGDSLARHIEECFNLPIGWLDQNRDQSSDNEVTLISEFRKVPLRTFREIENGEKHQHTTVCPFECSSSTYAFAVEGSANGPSAMHPSYGRAYPVGSIVFVDPEQTENLQHND